MVTLLEPAITTTADPVGFCTYTAQNPDLLAGLTDEAIAQIQNTFTRNLASGRAQRAWKHWSLTPAVALAELTLPDAEWRLAYLQRVIQIYRQEGARLRALAQRDDHAWQALNSQLAASAYHLLSQMGLDAALAADLAHDMAQQACCKIYVSTFPCDVAFDIWAHVILKNQILYQFTRSKDLLDRHRHIASFERLAVEQEGRYGLTPIGAPAHHGEESAFFPAQQIEDRDWLISAIAQLPSAERRAVLVYTYFYEFSDEEIAHHLGKSKGAIHTLRHRALKQLQTLL